MDPTLRSETLRLCIGILCTIGNKSTGLMGHPDDESRTKELFVALKKHSIPTDYDTVYHMLIEHGLADKHAKNIANLAQRINDGGRVVINYPRDWGERTVQRSMSEAAQRAEQR